MLEKRNKHNQIDAWIIYFSNFIIDSFDYTLKLTNFIIQKGKLYEKYKDKLNERQKKVIDRILKEGPGGFKGGLSAENYMRITSISRATTTSDIQDLVEKGILRKTGELKSTRYFIVFEEDKEITLLDQE